MYTPTEPLAGRDPFFDLENSFERSYWVGQRLRAPYPLKNYSFRPATSGSNPTPLIYIDPRDMTKRLDVVFGESWNVKVVSQKMNVVNIPFTPKRDDNSFSNPILKALKKEEEEGLDPETSLIRQTLSEIGKPLRNFLRSKAESKTGLYCTVGVELSVDRGFFKASRTNVGESVCENFKVDNLFTSAYSQAIKRAATLFGIAEYLYHIKLQPQSYSYSGGWAKEVKIPVEKMNNALMEARFYGICEETLEVIEDWRVAAYSMDTYGKVLGKTFLAENNMLPK
jgi:hypothetical protein